jgi:GT2 family glycosyltransferase
MEPKVSIVVLTHNHPAVFSRLYESLVMTEGVPYEVVNVDNGSDDELSRAVLWTFLQRGIITKLVLEPVNHFFSEGNNIGVRNSNPASEYILLLNSDCEVQRPDWLSKMVEWMEGVPKTLQPYTWCTSPTVPSPGPRDIVSIGWSASNDVPGPPGWHCGARPEGWCCMIRRTVWRDIGGTSAPTSPSTTASRR